MRLSYERLRDSEQAGRLNEVKEGWGHTPVLADKILEHLVIEKGGTYVDCTVGAAGHSLKILENLTSEGRLIAIDRDEKALAIAKENLKIFSGRIFFIHGNFKNLKNILENSGIKEVCCCLFDIGMSSMQISDKERGFSFQFDAPLDMRMDIKDKIRAADLVNNLSREKLENILLEFGEERYSNRIAKGIIRARQKKQIKTTLELVNIVLSSIPGFARFTTRIHPATRTFQALRIVVNDEINSLKEGISQAVEILKKEGRIFVISFHSIEDRIVKEKFRFLEKESKLKILTKKPIRPDLKEVSLNPRSRSAKLRIGEKI